MPARDSSVIIKSFIDHLALHKIWIDTVARSPNGLDKRKSTHCHVNMVIASFSSGPDLGLVFQGWTEVFSSVTNPFRRPFLDWLPSSET